MNNAQKEFEDWANVEGLRLERQKNMCGGDMGRYEFGPTQAAFEVWKDAWHCALKSQIVKIPTTGEASSFGRYVVFDREAIIEMLDEAGVSYE